MHKNKFATLSGMCRAIFSHMLSPKPCRMRSFGLQQTSFPASPIPQTLKPRTQGLLNSTSREWPRHCRKVCWTKMAQNGQNDHFGQNDLIPNRIVVLARPKWTKMVHFGLERSSLVHLGPPIVLWPLLSYWLSGTGAIPPHIAL